MPKDSTPHETGTKIQGHGRELLARVMARKAELEQALAEQKAQSPDNRTFIDKFGYEASLSVVNELLSGDTSDIREPVASSLSRWLATTESMPAAKRPASEKK